MPSTQVQEARISPAPMVNNLLINPGFEVWQRGNSFSTAGFTADEWRMSQAAGYAPTLSRTGTVKHGTYAAHMDGFGGALSQGIETWEELQGKWLTLSAWVKCEKEAGCYIAINANGLSSDAFARVRCSGGPDWEFLTVTLLVPTDLTQSGIPSYWPHAFPLRAVVGFQDGLELYMDSAMLVEGYFPEGVPFVPPNPAEDQERCNRFYQTNSNNAYDTNMYRQDVITGQTLWANALKFRTEMYAIPTMTLTNGNNSAAFPAAVGTVQATGEGFREYRTTTATASAQYFFSNWIAEVP